MIILEVFFPREFFEPINARSPVCYFPLAVLDGRYEIKAEKFEDGDYELFQHSDFVTREIA